MWGRRMRDRMRAFTVWEHIGCCCWLFLPGIVWGLYPLFWGRSVTFGYVIGSVFSWFFIACILGALLKIIYTAWWKLLVKLGKFSEKKLAVVTCAAFESSAYFQTGEFSRTHTIFKKFRVIATIDGKRSVGFVKGNLPPEKGTVLKVLIRPRRLRRWIIDSNQEQQ